MIIVIKTFVAVLGIISFIAALEIMHALATLCFGVCQ
jgi:hypothetical protein